MAQAGEFRTLMGDSFQFIDIIFFAMIAAFLVLRLRSVLGKRTGNEKQRGSPFDARGRSREERDDTVVDLPTRRRGDESSADEAEASAGPPGVSQVRAADPDFDPETFLGGARGAFEMIVAAFAKGDKDALRPLLSDEVFEGFAQAIDERENAGETMETELLGVKSVTLQDARVEDGVAFVTVEFVSDQVNVVRAGDGSVADGDADHIAKVNDVWTFARDTGSRDPNWSLVATRTPDED